MQKRILLLAILLGSFPLLITAQWTQQYSGSSENLRDVHMASPDTGWAVGMAGEILYTTDGGENWNSQTSGSNAPLLGVSAKDGMNGVAVGDFPPIGTMEGTILRTTDGGSNWNSIASGVPYVFTDVFFIDDMEGWIVGAGGGTIRHTTDGGQNWSDQSTSGDTLSAVHFVMPSVGWIAADDGEVLSTGDGGSTWSTYSTPTSENLWDLHFTGLSTGWAVGDNGTIIKTTNGGSSWSVQTTPGSEDLRGVHFIDANEGWAVGSSGTVLHTMDGGSTWTYATTMTNEDLKAVHFPVDTIGWAVGTNGEIIVEKGCMPASSSISPTVCDSFTSPDGDTTYTSSGMYRDTITVQGGTCDSIIDIDLSVAGLDTAVTMPSAGELQAQEDSASYQWLDCDSGMAPIPGATSQSYQPATEGNYAVVLSVSGCNDTSGCHSIQSVGIREASFNEKVRIAPNPTQGELRIELGSITKGLTLRIMDITGRNLHQEQFEGRSRIRYELEGEPGIYFIELEDAQGNEFVRKVVKE